MIPADNSTPRGVVTSEPHLDPFSWDGVVESHATVVRGRHHEMRATPGIEHLTSNRDQVPAHALGVAALASHRACTSGSEPRRAGAGIIADDMAYSPPFSYSVAIWPINSPAFSNPRHVACVMRPA